MQAMKWTINILLLSATLTASAQTPWSMQQCMMYAIEHNHEVKQAVLELDNRQSSQTEAVASFLPSLSAHIGGQYNFGRAIDPETNGYTEVSTFNNSSTLDVSLTVFDGMSRYHLLKAAQASTLMGKLSLRQRQDQTALDVLGAYTNVLYCHGMVQMAEEKEKETALLLRQTKLLNEIGRKSAADLALIEAQQAEAEYDLIHQQNLYASALLELKKKMAFPLADSLTLILDDTSAQDTENQIIDPPSDLSQHATLQMAYCQIEVSRQQWKQKRSNFLPTIYLQAELGTSYYKTLHSTAPSLGTQYKNNLGKYVGASMSIPLFSRLESTQQLRRAKNNLKVAQEQYEQKQLELEKLSREAWQDLQGYRRQVLQMQKKATADSLAYHLTHRQFEEGLCTAIDLHTTSKQWLDSKARLLQCRLMEMVTAQTVRYYNGETIWTK